jgi:heme oxygenase (mycobilin-producing)
MVCEHDRPSAFPFVAASGIRMPAAGRDALITAFRNRLHEVDRWGDFGGLQVWADHRDPERFVMVSWWTEPEALRTYLASEDHRRSHARIPDQPAKPRPDGLEQFTVVAR